MKPYVITFTDTPHPVNFSDMKDIVQCHTYYKTADDTRAFFVTDVEPDFKGRLNYITVVEFGKQHAQRIERNTFIAQIQQHKLIQFTPKIK